ncbi:hypothetical protein J608_5129, partial [Acinetobacter baumannii 1288284]
MAGSFFCITHFTFIYMPPPIISNEAKPLTSLTFDFLFL